MGKSFIRYESKSKGNIGKQNDIRVKSLHNKGDTQLSEQTTQDGEK